MFTIHLTPRQEKIVEIVRKSGPITGKVIADQLSVTRAALRSDLAILVMAGMIDARPKVGYYFTGKNTFRVLAEEINQIKVGDVLSVPVVVTAESSVYNAIVSMFLEDVGTLFIIDQGGLLAGVVSRKDLLKGAMGGGDLQHLPVKVLMTPLNKLVLTTADEPVLLAAKKMIDNEVDCLPVVRLIESPQLCEVVGRLTKTNIARLFVDIGEEKRR